MPTVVSGGPSVHKSDHSATPIPPLSEPAPDIRDPLPMSSPEHTDSAEEEAAAVCAEYTLPDSIAVEPSPYEIHGDNPLPDETSTTAPWNTPFETKDPPPAPPPSAPRLRGRHILLLQTVLCLLLAGGLLLLPALSPQTAKQLHPFLQERFTTGDGIRDSLTSHYQSAMAWLSTWQSEKDAASTRASAQTSDGTKAGDTEKSSDSKGEGGVADGVEDSIKETARDNTQSYSEKTPTNDAEDTSTLSRKSTSQAPTDTRS